MEQLALAEVDPFDLPEWLGTADVTWTAVAGLRTGARVSGRLSAEGQEPLGCDLLAVDEAYPEPVTGDADRRRAHLAWRHGQVLLARCAGDLVLAVPGTGFDADLVLESLSRLARAVGASEEQYAAHLRIGAQTPRRGTPGR